MNCMICDLYAVIDKQLSFSDPEHIAAEFAADIVTVLPPRGHGFHDLAILQQHYRTRT
jgi:hypothetical protein